MRIAIAALPTISATAGACAPASERPATRRSGKVDGTGVAQAMTPIKRGSPASTGECAPQRDRRERRRQRGCHRLATWARTSRAVMRKPARTGANVKRFDVAIRAIARAFTTTSCGRTADRLQGSVEGVACRVAADLLAATRGCKGRSMADAAFGEDTRMRLEMLRRQLRLPSLDNVTVRQLRGAIEYRGRRESLVGSGEVLPEWLPPERLPGQRTRATLRARDGGRDVFARRLDDGRFCVLVIQTPVERAAEESPAFDPFMQRLLGRRSR
jgi:hypothetical protein